MTRIRTTAQARRLRPLATVIAARKRFWRIADRLLIERPYPVGSEEYDALLWDYYRALRSKVIAEMAYMNNGRDLNNVRGARVLD